MKNSKKIATLLALALSLSTLCACMGNKPVAFTPYWAKNPALAEENITQTLTYDVSYQKSGSIVDYTVNYTNGTYTTSLSMEKQNNVLVYKYTTSFSIDAVYSYKGEDSELFHDTVETEVFFHTTQKSLAPISSKKVIKSSYPLNPTNPISVNDCYSTLDRTVETIYNEECTSGTTTMSSTNEKGEPVSISQTFEVPEKLTYLDNEQLLFAISGVTPNDNQTPSFSVYAPFTDAMQTVKISFDSAKDDTFTFEKDGERKDYSLKYSSVSIGISSNSNAGATQTAWFAYEPNSSSKEFRNVLLKLQTPISYSLGTLTYTLTSANFSA